MSKFNWNKIKWDKFELLALDYAKAKYPEFDWVKTPGKGYNQDNHDIEAEIMGHYLDEIGFSHEEIKLSKSYKIWGEVKHTNSGKKRIGKQQLDPTIVSALLAGNVIFLLFITNKEFAFSYKIRAERVLKDSTKFFDFVEKTDIEIWLNKFPPFTKKYFNQEILEKTQISSRTVELTDVCFFDFNDLKNKYYSLVKQLKINKEYVLYLSLKSESNNKCSILNEKSFPFRIESLQGFDFVEEKIILKKGTNNIFLFVKPTRITHIKSFNLQLLNEHTELFELEHNINVEINSFREIELVFSQQVMIVQKLIRIIIEKTQAQLLAMIYAQAGSGKSKILEKLYLEVGPRTEYLHVDFKDDRNLNAQKLCDLILFMNYGDFYSSLTNEIIEFFHEQLKFVDPFFLKKIHYASAYADGAENNLSHALEQNSNNNILNPKRLSQTKVIFCDDVHKLSGASAKCLGLILNEVIKNDLNAFIIMAAREQEFENNQLKNNINKISTIYRLQNPSPADIKETFNKYFDKSESLISDQLLEIHNLKVIVWEQIIKDIDREINYYPNDKFNFIQHLNHQIIEVTQRRDGFLKKIFLPFKNLWYLLDIIYLFKIGIEASLIEKIFIKNGTSPEKIRSHLDILLKENLIKKEKNLLLPWHDIYHKEYINLKSSENWIDEKLFMFLETYVNLKNNDQGYAVSLILKCNTKKKSKYINLAKSIQDKYYNDTNFGAALDISKGIFEYYSSNEKQLRPDFQTLFALFKYADCLNHCGSILDSQRLFREIYKTGITSVANSKVKCLAFESKSEVFSTDFWLLEVKDKLNDHFEFIRMLENNLNEFKKNKNFISAYLTSYNRLMTSLLLLDKYEEGEKVFKLNVEKAEDLNRIEYVGFAHMDYAKGIYHIEAEKALQHLKTADKIFMNSNQQRRSIDCKCEINFLIQILENKSLINLERSSENLRLKGLNNLYAKSLLKIAACLLVSGRSDGEKINELIEKACRVNAQLKNPRVNIICANLFTGLKYKFGMGIDVGQEVHQHIKLSQNIGYSYLSVAYHNKNIVEFIDFEWLGRQKDAHNGMVLIDPRIW